MVFEPSFRVFDRSLGEREPPILVAVDERGGWRTLRTGQILGGPSFALLACPRQAGKGGASFRWPLPPAKAANWVLVLFPGPSC